MMDAEIVVIGAGVMGLSVARALALDGRDVILVERARIGHDRGSSGGPTRIFRYAYDHPDYVRLAREALPRWREIEPRPEGLVRITGGLDAGDRDQLERCAAAMSDGGAHTEWLEGDALAARAPWVRLDAPVLFSPDTGIIDAAATLRVLAEQARSGGALLREETTAVALDIGDDGVAVRTDDGVLRARRCVVAAGGWAGPLLTSVGVTLPVHVTEEQVFYFDAPAGTMPVIYRGDHFFYTVPAFDGGPIIKVGDHVTGPVTSADAAAHAVDRARAAPLMGWTARTFPDATATGDADTCLYTMTSDEDFIIDTYGPLVIASPCSGHGFKFAPLIGEIVACLATDREPPASIERFALARFAAAGR